MALEARVRRTEIPNPTPDDPKRAVMQIEYTVGEFPPSFVYIEKSKWSPEAEAKAIKEHFDKRMKGVGVEQVSI